VAARLRALCSKENDDAVEEERRDRRAGREGEDGATAVPGPSAFSVPHGVRRGHRRGGNRFREGPGARTEALLLPPLVGLPRAR